MDEFLARRQRLCQQLADNSAAIVFASTITYRNRDVEYHFRQNSTFYYLTGFHEPDAVMLLLKKKGKTKYLLFVLPKDLDRELWDGIRTGPAKAEQDYLADAAFALTDLEKIIKKLARGVKQIYYPFADNKGQIKKLKSLWPGSKTQDLQILTDEMRIIKTSAELNLLRKVGEISARAHVALMRACKPGMYEYQLQALFYQQCLNAGCQDIAYPSIVGGGANACVLHYRSNRDKLIAGNLVLIDAGGEFDNYVADITRTLPINGKFSEAQQAVYAAVLSAQLAAIAAAKPGNPVDALQTAALAVLVPELVRLKILTGNPSDIIKNKSFLPVYMHGISHWLGLDVHDVGNYKPNGKARVLEPGMVLTVEPGVYIGQQLKNVPPQFLGIGIRIEDTIAITNTGCEVLSAAVPKEVKEIEQLMQ